MTGIIIFLLSMISDTSFIASFIFCSPIFNIIFIDFVFLFLFFTNLLIQGGPLSSQVIDLFGTNFEDILIRVLFSTSVELETDNVCLAVCVSITKLWGTTKSCPDIRYLNLWVFMIDCDNIWGRFFHFLKICILGPKHTSPY